MYCRLGRFVDGRCAYECTDVSYAWMIGRTLSYVVKSVGRLSFVRFCSRGRHSYEGRERGFGRGVKSRVDAWRAEKDERMHAWMNA